MYSTFATLLEEKGARVIDVSKATGIHSAVFSEWKKGKSTPKIDKLKKIATYFGVDIDCFAAEDFDEWRKEYNKKNFPDAKNDPYYTDPETAQIAQEIFESSDLRTLFSTTRHAKPENVKRYIAMIKAMEEQEKGGD